MMTLKEARTCLPGYSEHTIGAVEVVEYETGFTRIRYHCTVCEATGTMGLYSPGLNWNETLTGITKKRA